MKTVHIGQATLEIVSGDIAAQQVDAIVNAANDYLWMGSGVAGAIKRAGGAAIEQEAIAQGPIAVGSCVLTSAGNLPARRVIHAAVMGQDLHTNADIIRRATRNAIELAEFESMASIALPAFGTGVGGFRMEECAAIMIEEAVMVLQRTKHLKLVRFVLFDSSAATVFSAALGRRFSAQ